MELGRKLRPEYSTDEPCSFNGVTICPAGITKGVQQRFLSWQLTTKKVQWAQSPWARKGLQSGEWDSNGLSFCSVIAPLVHLESNLTEA